MSLAEHDIRPNIGTAQIVTLDIERLPGTFTAEFWDLNAFKNRRIHPDLVVEWPRTICAAWKWYDSKRTYFAAEWEPEGRESFLRAAWDVYDRADIVIGHAVKRFDTAKLRGEWKLLGLDQPSPVKFVDTLTVARAEFGFESNTLDSLCARFGIARKVDKYDARVARAATEGDVAAQRRIKRYNIGDVVANEGLYDQLRGWITGHPHLGLYSGDEYACPQCGHSEHVKTKIIPASVHAYQAYKCTNCGAPLRRNHAKKTTTMRPAR
jgi:DNA-directed RNA polymerase subunit RPC12/RpoP